MEHALCVKTSESQTLPSGYEEAWFDDAHQHFLLLKQGRLSIWDSKNSHTQLYDLGDEYRKQRPPRILFAKLSLDKDLIVLQFNDTQLTVYDLRVSSQQWNLEIKSAYDNRVIDEGLIWSQHGGGSDDLIIITVRGAEMYKISSKRNQCKLSRVLNQGYSYHARYWYEPNHRVMLLASPLNALDSSNSNSGGFLGFFATSNKADEQRKVLLQDLGGLALNGYFLRVDKHNVMPKLELPPPDKTPTWQVGPRVHESDVALVAVYDAIYCIVHMRQAPEFHLEGALHLYRMNKYAVAHTHTLQLVYPEPELPPLGTSLAYSVTDNLLVVHCKRVGGSVVFDLAEGQPGQDSSMAGPEVDGGGSKTGSAEVGGHSLDVTGGGSGDRKRKTNNKKKKKKQKEEQGDVASRAGLMLLRPLAPAVALGQEKEEEEEEEEENEKEKVPGPNEAWYVQPTEESVLSSHEQHLLQCRVPARALAPLDAYDSGEDDPRFCRWQVFPPYWLWDKKTRTLSRIRARLGTLLAAVHHRQPAYFARFLLRRGAPLRAPRAVYVFCYTIVCLSFLVCDVSLSLTHLLLPVCIL
jgi:hypothetical protein